MKFSVYRSLQIMAALVAAFFLMGLSGCGEEPAEEAENIIRPVRYTTLEAGEHGKSRTFSGTVVSARESSLSFKVAGTVRTIDVNVGDVVSSGSLLAQIDETDLKVDLESARAGLKAAEADAQASLTAVNTTRSNYARIEKLYESDNVSLSEFEQARGDYETAQAQRQAANSQVKTARAKLQAAQNQLGYTRLTAPFSGVINAINVEENEEISPGAPILVISGFDKLEVKVNLSDLYITNITKDMACTVTFPSLEEITLKGIVTEVPFAASESPTYPVKIAIQSLDKRIRPGMAADVTFNFGEIGGGSTLFLPVDGVGEDGEGNFVFLLKKKDGDIYTAEKQRVTLGPLAEQGFQVESGVEAGDRIATSGLQILLDGMEVTLLQQR